MAQKKSVQGRKWVEAGERNALLVAVRFSHRDKWRANYWLFKCDCGEETFQRPDYVKHGRVLSCGCYRDDMNAERMTKLAATHGHTKNGKLTSEYNSWRNMRDRCRYPTSDNWLMYGGRGIKVCQRWDTSFDNFLEDMGLKPTPKHTIGRVDQDGDYEPSNCQWETVPQQNRNRRDNRFIIYCGQTVTIAEACRLAGLPRGRVNARLRAGWTIERVFSDGDGRKSG
ncbi:hypothetical protein [Bradyrhizobium sp. 62]|uniref:hypothetical protein n=1 Tax=Bradyrhizobium sp. 62 TaxID=1043588 RepID=UPI001FFBF990|nr:hypothetical protein [Bradyrhizobium sp. 62]MCK1367625.1 hypothetical protein [Bradyrhizobium sp. 62]